MKYLLLSSSEDPLFRSLLQLVRERDGGKLSEIGTHLTALINRGMRFAIAVEKTHVVGYTLFETAPRSRGRTVFSTVETYVSPFHRRRGIAYRIALSLGRFAREEGVSAIVRHFQSSTMLDLGDKMAKSPRLFNSGKLKGKWAERTRVVMSPRMITGKVVTRVRRNH